MNDEASVGTTERVLKPHSGRPTQEYFGATPQSLRELAKKQNKKPAEVILPVFKLSGLISEDESVEDIGPGAIAERMKIVIAREITRKDGKSGTEFKRGTVVDMKDDPDQNKTFRLRQPDLVPRSKGDAVLLAEVNNEVFMLNEITENFQNSKTLILRVI